MKSTKSLLAIVILSLLLCFSIVVILSLKRQNKQNLDLIESLTDSLTVTRQNDSSLKATIAVLETENAQQFLKLVSKDSQILELQELVKQYKSKLNNGGSVTIIGTETNTNTKNPTIVTEGEVVSKDSIVYVYPIYTSNFNLKDWVKGNVVATKDSTEVSLSVKNDYSIVIGEEGGWFKKKRAFVDVISHNPYSEFTKLRTYKVTPPKAKRFGIGVQAGYGLILSNNPTFAPYVGVGVNYNFIKF